MSEFIPGRGKNKICAYCRKEYINSSCHVVYCSFKCYRDKNTKPPKIVTIKPPKAVTTKPPSLPKPRVINEESRLKSKLSGIRSRSIKKGVPFDLTVEVIQYIVSQPCIYCGAPGPSEIDRKVPSYGYVISNCTSACRRCNTIKNNTVSYEDMIKLVKFLHWEF